MRHSLLRRASAAIDGSRYALAVNSRRSWGRFQPALDERNAVGGLQVDDRVGLSRQELGRAGQPAELAPVYVFLASDESSYITGEVIGVTGGKPLA